MTKVKLLTGLALGIFMAGCNSEEALEAPGMKTLKVQVEEYTPSTRVGFTDGEAAFFWTAGDKIGTTTDKAKNAFSGMALIAGAEVRMTFSHTSGFGAWILMQIIIFHCIIEHSRQLVVDRF